MNRETKYILLTIDVEDWFQVENLRTWYPPESWSNYPLRVIRNTHRLMDLLDRHTKQSVKATFFMLGWVAERAPDLVREINRRGHEVASHGYGHLMCNQLGSEALNADLVRSKHLLEDIIGEKVRGYRAPNFSISDEALNLVQSAGYDYDSSFNNFSKHGRYGSISVNGASKNGISVSWNSGFKELPISNLSVAKRVVPWGGGGYFRFYPASIFRTGVRKILNRDGAYLFYLHPWEIDPEQPRPSGVGGLSGWRHYLNLEKTFSRLDQLINHFDDCRFTSCSQYISSLNEKLQPAR